jgi:hypothetical protein
MKIAYYPEGDRTLASSRMRVYRVGDALEKRGHQVAYNPFNAAGCSVMVVQKKAAYHLRETMRQARAHGVRVIWDCDDWLADGPVDLVDTITVDTPSKRELYPGAMVVPDALDVDDGAPVKIMHAETLERVVWFGGADNVHHAGNVAEACRRMGLMMTVITNLDRAIWAFDPNVTGVMWGLKTVDGDLVKHDAAVCSYVPDPRGLEWVHSKSANRVLKAWGLGLPVAGTPIPDYVEVGLHYLATTVPEWITVLDQLRDRTAREVDALAGWHVAQKYQADRIAALWERVFIYEPAHIGRG